MSSDYAGRVVPDPHRNCFYYYRGPSSAQDDDVRQRQVEDNTTKALINVLEYSIPALTDSFLARFVGAGVGEREFFLQSAPAADDTEQRRLIAISRITDPKLPFEDKASPGGESRPDAAIHIPGRALVLFEVKVDLSLDVAQLRNHASRTGIDLAEELHTVSWTDIAEWAAVERDAATEPVTRFLLEQFGGYMELLNLTPFAGFRDGDFDFFVAPTLDRQQEVKGRLDALWQAVAEQLPGADRKALGEFHVGALGFNDPNAWALTNWREKTINLTLEINREEV